MLKRDRQQTCKVCKRPDKFDFDLPDDVWAEVVPHAYRNRVVCLACFDEFAREAGVEYAAHLRALYFAGDRAAFAFNVVSWANV